MRALEYVLAVFCPHQWPSCSVLHQLDPWTRPPRVAPHRAPCSSQVLPMHVCRMACRDKAGTCADPCSMESATLSRHFPSVWMILSSTPPRSRLWEGTSACLINGSSPPKQQRQISSGAPQRGMKKEAWLIFSHYFQSPSPLFWHQFSYSFKN